MKSPGFSRQHGRVKRGWFQIALAGGVALAQIGTLSSVTVYASGNPDGIPVSTQSLARLAGCEVRTIQRHVTAFMAVPDLELLVIRDKNPGVDDKGNPHSQLTRYGLPAVPATSPRTLVWRSVMEWPAYRQAPPAFRGIYWLIAELCGPSGRRASGQWIAKLAGCDIRTVRKAVAYWRDHGLIDVVQQADVRRGQLANILRVVPPSAALARGNAGRAGVKTQRSAAGLVDEVGLALATMFTDPSAAEAFHRTLEDAVSAPEPRRRMARRDVEKRIRSVIDHARNKLGMEMSSRITSIAHAMVQPLFELWPTYCSRAEAIADELLAEQEIDRRRDIMERERLKLARGGRDYGAVWVGDWAPPNQKHRGPVATVPTDTEWNAALDFALGDTVRPWAARDLQPTNIGRHGDLVLVVPQAWVVDQLIDTGAMAAIQAAAGGRISFRLRSEQDRLEAAAIRRKFLNGPPSKLRLKPAHLAFLVDAGRTANLLDVRTDAFPDVHSSRPGFTERDAVNLYTTACATRGESRTAMKFLHRALDALKRGLLWTADSIDCEPDWQRMAANVAEWPEISQSAALAVTEAENATKSFLSAPRKA